MTAPVSPRKLPVTAVVPDGDGVTPLRLRCLCLVIHAADDLRVVELDAGELGEITARMDGTLELRPGERVELGFDAQHLYRFDADGKAL